MYSERRKNHGCGQKKPKSTSSAIFGVETAAKSCELKRCADRVRTDEANLNFSPELYLEVHCRFSLIACLAAILKSKAVLAVFSVNFNSLEETFHD